MVLEVGGGKGKGTARDVSRCGSGRESSGLRRREEAEEDVGVGGAEEGLMVVVRDLIKFFSDL